MQIRTWVTAIVLVLALAVSALAQTITVVEESQPVVIPYSQEREFQFDQTSPANNTILLKIKSRMETESQGGSMMFLKLILNGKEIKPAKGRMVSRLVNKPLDTPVAPGTSYNWYTERDGWNVLYSPDFQTALSEDYYVGNPYLYVLDITDLVNPIAENRLKVINTGTEYFMNAYMTEKKLDLVIGSVEIETRPGKSPTMDLKETEIVNIINTGTPAAGPSKYAGKVLPGGGIELLIGKRTYNFGSSFSYPDAGFNRLQAGKPAANNQKGFKVSVKGNTVTATGPNYIVNRKVTFLPQRIQIDDSIKNLSRTEALGMCVKHELNLSNLVGSAIRLAGNPDTSVAEYHSYGNPSVHLVTPEGGLGIIAEDDVFRHQVKLYAALEKDAEFPVAGIRTEMLHVGPGETYTLTWSIYPVAGPDYYDFVNLVREDWGANYTALGPWRWGIQEEADKPLSVDQLRKILKDQDIKYFMSPDWALWTPNSRIAMGTDVFSDYWEPYRKSRMDTINKLHKASEDIKTVWYFNSRRETSDDTLTRFPDSLMTDENGNPSITYWPNCGATNPSYTMVPTLKNSFGKAMLETARRYLDEVKLDGIYWDEAEGIMFNSILYTNNMPDGHSCILDPNTWRIKHEVGIMPLLEKDYYREIAKMVHSRGKILLANGPTGFKTTLQDKVQRMTEIQHNDVYGYEGNLQTPLGYMCWGNLWQEAYHALEQGMVPAVFLTTELSYDLSSYLFPFTTIELHSGYLLAKERIVTIHSGNYGWQENLSLVKVRHFDSSGKLTTKDFATTIADRASTNVAIKAKEAVVLVKLPVIFAPAKGSSASVRKVSYSPEGFSANISAPKGGVLKVFSGEYQIKNGQVVDVIINNKVVKTKATGNFLKITLPQKYAGIVKIGIK